MVGMQCIVLNITLAMIMYKEAIDPVANEGVKTTKTARGSLYDVSNFTGSTYKLDQDLV